MISTLEKGEHHKIRKSNFDKLTTIGTPLVEKTSHGFIDSISIDQLSTTDGNMLKDNLLRIVISDTRGRGSLILQSSNHDYLSQFTYTVYEKGQIIEIAINIDTFLNEGLGLGSALFNLGQTMIEKTALQYSDKTVVAYLVAKSRKRVNTTSSRKDRTSTIAKEYGYSNIGSLHKTLGYAEGENIFLKRIK